MSINLSNWCNRNTPTCEISIGNFTFLFSYETAVAYTGLVEDKRVRGRLVNVWGKTTGRHINDWGAKNYPEITKKEMEDVMNQAITSKSVSLVREKFSGM